MSEKPRLLEITDSWTLRVLEANQGDIGVPWLINGRFVNSEDFKRWKTSYTSHSETEAEPR